MFGDLERARLQGSGPDHAFGTVEESVSEWLHGHLQLFDPFDWQNEERRSLQRKAFDELPIYLYVAEHQGAPDERLRRFVLERVNDARYRKLVRRHPRRFLLYSFPIRYAASLGELRPETRAAAEDVLAQDAFWAVQRPPFRSLDAWHHCRLTGSDCRYDLDDLLPVSTFEQRPDPVTAELDDAYALTHDVMFLTNFGVDDPAFAEQPAPYDVSTELQALLLRYLAEGHSDIVVELVLAGALQHQLPRDLAGAVLCWLATRVDRRGYVPGPKDESLPRGPEMSPGTFDGDDETGVEAWGAEAANWAKNYHTSLLSLITVAVLRSEWDDLPARPAGYRLGTDYDPDALLVLGEAYVSLSEYDLEAGAGKLAELAGTPVAAAFPDVYEYAVTYVEQQRRADGAFGYWVDERSVYADRGYDEGTFDRNLVRGVSNSCRELLIATRSVRD